MSSVPFPSAIDRFEARLRQSAEMFAARSLDPGASSDSAALGFARRYGFLEGEPTSLATLGAATRRALKARLEEENRRLARAARRNAPDYDLGRHIALRRALNALAPDESQPALPPVPTADKPLSGRELNTRFRRHGPRAAPPERKSVSPARRPMARAG
ncbi:hypothetical protein ACP4J4_08195 [Aureimonas ureilytica]|uniref:hypothetical protein n=1 Tax=Aureimonas ureilytica TaxID=401562 RepID=UPI003CF8A113